MIDSENYNEKAIGILNSLFKKLRNAIYDYEGYLIKIFQSSFPQLKEAKLDDAPKDSSEELYYMRNVIADIFYEVEASFGTSTPRKLNLSKVHRHINEDPHRELFGSTELTIGGHILGIGNRTNMTKLKEKIESIILDDTVRTKVKRCKEEAKKLPSEVFELVQPSLSDEYRILWR